MNFSKNLVMAADFFESEMVFRKSQGRTLVLEELETLLAHKFKSKDGELSESKIFQNY